MGLIGEDKREKAVKFTTRFMVVGFLCYVAGALNLAVDQDLMEMFPWGIAKKNPSDAATVSAAEAACGTAQATAAGSPTASNQAAATAACTAAGMASGTITSYSGPRGSVTKQELVFPTSSAGTTYTTADWEDGDACYDQALLSTIALGAAYLLAVFSVFFTSKRGDAFSDYNKKKTLIANFGHVAALGFGFWYYYDNCGNLEAPEGFLKSEPLGFLEEDKIGYGLGLYLTAVGALSQVFGLLVNIFLDAGASNSFVY